MATATQHFLCDQLDATERFAQTMIVVDDEADMEGLPEDSVPERIRRRPGRSQARAAAEVEQQGADGQAQRGDFTHLLDARRLMDCSLDHGLVCSILRPEKDDDLRERFLRAARRVDIVCLDWEIHGDGGKLTRTLIGDIVEDDRLRNGRLRMIVIYTAERGRVRILESIRSHVLSALSRAEKAQLGLVVKDGREIQSKIGLRVVCFVKAYDSRAPQKLLGDQVSERELPRRILQEFATLSEGLMSNVALGTLAAIRDSAHQVVGAFTSDIDGPYFHHRAILPNPDEAEDFAISVVLDALRSAVRLQEVGQRFAGRPAVERRLRHIASSEDSLRLLFKRRQEDQEKSIIFPVDDVVRLINEGINREIYDGINVNGKPRLAQVKQSLTSFFTSTTSHAHEAMRRFAAITGIASHPGTHDVASGDYTPSLGLGSVVLDKVGEYWLCIQASCDSLRIAEPQPFLFVPFERVEGPARYIVPRFEGGVEKGHAALRIQRRVYSKSMSVQFAPSPGSDRVLASWGGRPRRLRFVGTDRRVFDWVADLKHYPALKVAQEVGQQMGRLGYDEFEPFRNEQE